VKIKADPSGSDSAGPSDTGHSDHDASILDVSVKADSSSADGGMPQDSSILTQPSDTSTFDSSSPQISTQKDVTPTSSSANVTATTMTADDDGQIAADIAESTESPMPASDNLADGTALSSPGTSTAALPGMTKNENMDDIVDKVDNSEDISGNDTIATQVINKT